MNVLEKILEEIDKTEENYSHRGHSPTFLKGACNMYADVKEIIRSHMDEVPDTNVGKWIPVSERLPNEEETKKNTEFIVMIEGAGNPTVLFYTDGYWQDENENFYYSVVAWRPLPEPYKEGEHD